MIGAKPLFLQETEAHGITPVRYAALQTVCLTPEIDQRTLAAAIALDTSTTGGVRSEPIVSLRP